ncbi:MAG TPA: hypothetical protein VE968_04755 [Sphingomicrobium sp.]|nr:hypothetical protein [Sphingomicrobium sp.]
MQLLRNFLLAAAILSGLTGAPALADHPRAWRPPNGAPPPREQERAWEATRDGRSMPLRMLERRVMPLMGGADYLGPELNGDTYRFKFLQNGRVIWVDVDGQGRIIRRSSDR